MNADGTSRRRVRRDVTGFAYWSPDGSRFALVEDTPRPPYNTHVFVMKVNGTSLRRLTEALPGGLSPGVVS